MIIEDLEKRKLISPPPWLSKNTIYLTYMGSMAYGTTLETSDVDVYGICIPNKSNIFPHLAGEIQGFGTQVQKFEQYQQHHVSAGNDKVYDFTIFGIVKYFNLVMQNNPNCLDSLFVPQNCIIHSTKTGVLIRENRKMFLHKGCFQKFKGYAFSQMHKMKSKDPKGKRKEIREKYGFDCKFGMHLVRLLGEVEQILLEGDIDLQRNKEQLKAIRRGEMTEQEIIDWASEKERQLEKCYSESQIPQKPDEDAIKQLLLNCLEEHYGSLDNAITQEKWAETSLKRIDEILNSNRNRLYIN